MGEMNVSKVTAKGQVTIPLEFRKLLNIKEGDYILFVSNGSGVVEISKLQPPQKPK